MNHLRFQLFAAGYLLPETFQVYSLHTHVNMYTTDTHTHISKHFYLFPFGNTWNSVIIGTMLALSMKLDDRDLLLNIYLVKGTIEYFKLCCLIGQEITKAIDT